MRDTELYQTLLGLTPPWEVTAVNITQSSAGRPLGEVAVTVRWRANAPFLCPNCGQPAPRYDFRPRRWRHLNTMDVHYDPSAAHPHESRKSLKEVAMLHLIIQILHHDQHHVLNR